jgi:hypothetical protein
MIDGSVRICGEPMRLGGAGARGFYCRSTLRYRFGSCALTLKYSFSASLPQGSIKTALFVHSEVFTPFPGQNCLFTAACASDQAAQTVALSLIHAQ